jgi:streptogramin lyase
VHIGISAILILSLLAAATVHAGELKGNITDTNGNKLSQVGVTLDRGADVKGPNVVTVFSDEQGQYRFPTDITVNEGTPKLRAWLMGYHQVGLFRQAAPDIHGQSDFDIVLEPTANVASTASASAWLAQTPDGEGKHTVQLFCTGCHQFPSEKVRHFAQQAEAIAAQGGQSEGEIWRHMVRYESWRSMVKYMRAKAYEIYPDKSPIDVANIPWKTVQAPEYSLFNGHDEEVIAKFLSDYLPRQFDHLDPYNYGAPLGVNGRTVMREYQLPDTSLVREATMVNGSPYLWGADIQKNRLLRLDMSTGEQKWYPVPKEGPSGPHTIIGGSDGNVWVSMLEGDILGRFNPKTEEWKLWPLGPSDLPPTKVFGDQAMVHDISYDANYHLAKDNNNNIWLTLIGINKMGSLNPDTGSVSYYDAFPIEGRSGVNVSLYGTLLQSDGKCAWYSQLSGVVACLNTETHKSEHVIKFPPGSGPRRMAIDENDILWIPLYGAGQLVKYDTKQNKTLATYDVPDRSSAPYALLWDVKRQMLWVGTTNADLIYGFNPKTEKFTVLPLPRKQGYFRKLALNPVTDQLVASYSNIPTGSGPSMALVIDVGDEGNASRAATGANSK